MSEFLSGVEYAEKKEVFLIVLNEGIFIPRIKRHISICESLEGTLLKTVYHPFEIAYAINL